MLPQGFELWTSQEATVFPLDNHSLCFLIQRTEKSFNNYKAMLQWNTHTRANLTKFISKLIPS